MQKKNEVGITKEQNEKKNGKGSVFGRCDQILTQIGKIKSSSNNAVTSDNQVMKIPKIANLTFQLNHCILYLY